MTDRLHRLMAPRSVAMVGASPSGGGNRQAVANLLEPRFGGRMAAVNPRYQDVLGIPCVPSLLDLDFIPDAVFVGLRASDSVQVVRDAARMGVGGVVIVAGGFAEGGPDGKALQEELREVAVNAQMPLIGPNCQGIINFALPVALYLRRVSEFTPGPVALASQSGSVTTAIVNNRYGVRMRHVVSSGNEAVTTSADLLAYWIEQDEINTIALFMETIREPKRFLEQCDRAAAAGKAVVVLKAGRTDEARLAGISHSGTLSPPDRLIDAVLMAHGVIRVDSLEELLGTSLAVSGRRSKGNRLSAITISGGHVEVLHDHAPAAGVTFPELAPESVEQLRLVLPPSLHPSNPLDSWGLTNQEEDFDRCLAILAADPGIDVVIVMAEPWQHPTGFPGQHKTFIEAAKRLARKSDKLVVLLSSVFGANSDLADEVIQDGVLPLAGIRDGLRSLGNLATLASKKQPSAPVRLRRGSDVLDADLRGLGSGPVAGEAALRLLAKIGVEVVETRVASSAEEAVRIAGQMACPVVVKSGREGLVHKLDVGAVSLDLATEQDVRDASTRMLKSGLGPLLIQPMVSGGAEVILGILTHSELGAFILVGAGGTWAELIDDTTVISVPLRDGDARAMVDRLRIAPLLVGGRGQKALDVKSLVNAIEALGAFAETHGNRIQSLDVNPVKVLENRVLGLDAVVVPAPDNPGLTPDAPSSEVGL
jgi:acetate---CoA ligase (ADP-forming)